MKITIVGLGLIGASIAKALSGRAEIRGIDHEGCVIDQALSQGVIGEGSSDLSLAGGSDMVIIAVPVGRIVEIARGLIPHIGPDTLITDTGSTKAHIVECIDELWPWFVGSHPIAGKEVPGYSASQADLFSGKAAIITPSNTTKSECIERATWLWEECGARVTVINPCMHDELMAVISHMPHLVSFASMSFARDLHIHRDLLGAGFRDFTRIAASDPVMWKDIFLANKQHILQLIDG
ncbi:MAG TPA: prephenate dehydrogenase, partial [Deltaproteobacteria bacterium]|nr:prephenate dehydrogenase [Deltaproteobacteria bacterium]